MGGRYFESGAYRDTDEGKLDIEGFLNPLVVKRFSEYMHVNRVQSDGKLRDSDNWQKGIPPQELLKSLLRHVLDLHLIMRGYPQEARSDINEALGGIMFNCQAIWLASEEGKC